MALHIAVDAMGGDDAPSVVVEGALEAASATRKVVLVGPAHRLREALDDYSAAPSDVDVLDAPEVIGMDEAPAAALKRKPRSSIHVGLEAVRTGRAHAFVSAGNTGAVMAAAMLLLGRIPGVARPALPGIFPTTNGFCVVLDVGANMDCRAEHLVQFARMGRVYAERVLGLAEARVGLLNVGEEPSKGNEAAKAAHALLAEADDLHFAGNVEGRDVMLGGADVVVCDGFVGNILLKFGESVKTVLPALVRREVAGLGGGTAQGGALLQQVLGAVMRRFSYEEVGGTPLLGVDGTVLIGHGGSSARAIARMVETAADMVRAQVGATLAGTFHND